VVSFPKILTAVLQLTPSLEVVRFPEGRQHKKIAAEETKPEMLYLKYCTSFRA